MFVFRELLNWKRATPLRNNSTANFVSSHFTFNVRTLSRCAGHYLHIIFMQVKRLIRNCMHRWLHLTFSGIACWTIFVDSISEPKINHFIHCAVLYIKVTERFNFLTVHIKNKSKFCIFKNYKIYIYTLNLFIRLCYVRLG